MTKNQEALHRAATGQSAANYDAIINGFLAKGIEADDIKPRENVFTFHAWKALGRSVKKGEHGVKVLTWIESTKTDENGQQVTYRRPKTTTVFHVSQTEPTGEQSPASLAEAITTGNTATAEDMARKAAAGQIVRLI